MHGTPVKQRMDMGFQQDEVHVNARYHKYTLSDKYNVLEGNLQASSAPEDVRTSSASRERSSTVEGLRDLRIFPKMRDLRIFPKIGDYLQSALRDVLLLCLLRLIFDFTEHLYRYQAAKRT
ncbi:hypothetical protein L6452_00119 [Arctium lappa]|uniref:Uncharacterized protein n=1 Tax=Arctium lappa TaxID=4217 RepID=A0ACB9FE10_ARCLA|nr:hypothetical protein L6452_00119 [Arctium lappa]